MHKKWKILLGCGIGCILIMLISSWYTITYNDSRFVVPMNFESYIFQVKDLPMIISGLLTLLYSITLIIILFLHTKKRIQQAEKTNITRNVNPHLGLLGFLGFLGFVGFWTYSKDGSVFPFAFFSFFGFYYEGKMSGTFMDERFYENAVHAKLKASNITLSIIFVALLLLCQGRFFNSLEYTLIITIIVLSLALALYMFLSEYLLYRYDHDDQRNESEE